MLEEAAADERRRIEALQSYEVLDTEPEEAFDNVTELCTELLDVPIALVTLVDATRQWFKSRRGIGLQQTERSIAFCAYAIRQAGPMLVEDATADNRFAANPLVTNEPKIRFYAGVPLTTSDGFKLGTLCVIDRRPRLLQQPEIDTLVRLARQVEIELELRKRARFLARQIAEQRMEKREQEMLASMVVHDLRNPLTSIVLAAVAGLESNEAGKQECLSEITAAARRAQDMLSQVLDICLAQTGKLCPRRGPIDVRSLLESAAYAVRRQAETRHVRIDVEVQCGSAYAAYADREMLIRCLINLLENSIRYSPPGQAVSLRAASFAEDVKFMVEDYGPGIGPADSSRVFEPFASTDQSDGHRGLGLAFCRVVANSHGGSMWVEPNAPTGSRFVLQIPLKGTS